MKKEMKEQRPLWNVHLDYFNGSHWDIPVTGPREAEEVGKKYAKMDDVMNVYYYPIGFKEHIFSHVYIKRFERKAQ